MVHNLYLKKDALTVPEGRQHREVKFKPASEAEIKALGDDLPEGYIAGWASTPDLDLYRHVVMPGAFDKSISSKGLSGPKGIKLLIGHDYGKPGGVIKKLETRNGSLWMEAQLNLKISYVRDIYEAAKDNGGFSFSVGFYLGEWQWVKDSSDDSYLQINEADLEEVSLVVFPGNPEAVNTFIKGISDEEAFETITAMEKAIVASGAVKSRNEAQRLIKMFKRNVHLLKVMDDTPVVPSKPAPVAKEKLDAISTLLAELQSALD